MCVCIIADMDLDLIQLGASEVEDIEERLEAFDSSFTGVEPEGSVAVGFMDGQTLVAGAQASMTTFDILYVSTVFVDEAYRGRGLGTKLLEEVERQARELGARLIRLDTFDWQGVGFYEKLGYEQVGHYTAPVAASSSGQDQEATFAEHFYLKRL